MSDLISKQKAIEAIRDFQSQITCDFTQEYLSAIDRGINYAVSVIGLMDTVEAEPVRHGHWTDNDIDPEAWNFCSVCGEQAIDNYDYCPWCGAKMDEVSE